MLILRSILFAWKKLFFLVMLLVKKSIKMDEKNVKIIQKWSMSKSITEIKRFHDLASFYRKFVKHFNILTTPHTKIVKKSIGFK